MQPWKCFLDLDEVLAAFVSGACKLHGREIPNPWPEGVWLLSDAIGMHVTEFWNPIDHDFWEGLDWTPDGREILGECERWFGRENICILSDPSEMPSAASGKMAWVKRHLPEYSRQMFTGSPKHFGAHGKSVLIDDSEDNCKAFRKHGGRVVLVPRPWNCLSLCDTVGGVKAGIGAILG